MATFLATFLAGIITVLFVAAVHAVSWLITCGIVYLITLCFGWTFTWPVATGIWLVIYVLKSIFNVTVKK